MPSLSNAAAFVVSFGIQTFLVFAGNSRFFGRLKEGSGWRTNVEMSVLYTSFVTPANYAFGIWGIIYTFELVAVCVLALSELELISNPVGGSPETILWCWVLMNASQATWSILFARSQLLLSTFALSGIAASLVGLGLEATAGSSWLGYLTVCCPARLQVDTLSRGLCTQASARRGRVRVSLGRTVGVLLGVLASCVLTHRRHRARRRLERLTVARGSSPLRAPGTTGLAACGMDDGRGSGQREPRLSRPLRLRAHAARRRLRHLPRRARCRPRHALLRRP
jgi:hypothetical protein